MKKPTAYSAIKLKTDEELKQHLFKVIEDTAKKNGKDIYSVSLEDIYQALTEIRNSWYGFILRRIKLSQFITLKKTADKISPVFTVVSAFKNPIYLAWLPIKKHITPKIKNLSWHFGVKWFFKKIYKQNKKSSNEIEKTIKPEKTKTIFFKKKLRTTPELETVIGVSFASQSEATKKIWEYIRKYKLQDKKNLRQINIDGTALEKIFPGKKSISVFDLPAGINKHLIG